MNVLSLFDGVSCGMVALQRAGIKADNYFASEIDKYSIQTSKKNYPNIIQLGDVKNWKEWSLPKIDLLLAGSPCQGFSISGKGLNFNDPRSKLFFEFVDILNFYKPKYFLLENVKMKGQWRDIITDYLKVDPIFINSNLVSAQNRPRYYWTNIPYIEQPKDRHIYLKDILLSNKKCPGILMRGRGNNPGGFRAIDGKDFCPRREKELVPRTDGKSNCLTASMTIELLVLSDEELQYMQRKTKDGRNHFDFKHHSDSANEKSSCVVANFTKGVPYNVLIDKGIIRKLHPIECERLQTLPDNYTEGVSNTQRYKQIGNGWTVNVIVHILKGIK